MPIALLRTLGSVPTHLRTQTEILLDVCHGCSRSPLEEFKALPENWNFFHLPGF